MPSVKNNPNVLVLNLDTNVFDPLAYIDFYAEKMGLTLDNINRSILKDDCLETIPDKESLDKRKDFYIDFYKAIRLGYVYPFISYTALAEIKLANNPIFSNFVDKYCYTQRVVKSGKGYTLECMDEIMDLANSFVSQYKYITQTGEERIAPSPMKGQLLGMDWVPQRDAIIAATGCVFGLNTITNNAKDFVLSSPTDIKGRRRLGIVNLCIKYGYIIEHGNNGFEIVGRPVLVSELQDVIELLKQRFPQENPFGQLHYIKSRLNDFQKSNEVAKILEDKLQIPIQDKEVSEDIEDNAGEDFDSSNINENLLI